MTATYLLTQGNLLWEILDKYGHDAETIFFKEGISKEMLFEEGKRITFEKMNELWVKASRLIRNPCFGLEAAELWHPSFFGALGYAWLASVTLRKALSRLERYIHVLSDETKVRLEEHPEGLTLILSDSIQPPEYMDLTMAVIVHMCRLNCGQNFHPLSVNIIHKKPDCSGKYFSVFRAPVHFGAKTDSIIFSHDDIDIKLPSGNPHLATLSDQMMINYLADLDCENIVNRVKSAIIEHLHDGKINSEKIAKHVFMSLRSLQRTLSNAGTTFGNLLDETRKALAENYVADPKHDLTEIAFKLGYAEQSSFTRAFKRWTGESPNEYRKSNRLSQ